MSEDEELKRRIARLSSRINQHKLSTSPQFGHGSMTTWVPHRGSPYGVRRAGQRYRTSTYRNRTLVLNNGGGGTEQPVTGDADGNASTSQAPVTTTPQWVSKRDRHMQLINTAVYDQVSQRRAKDIEETQAGLKQARDVRDMTRLGHHFSNTAGEQDQGSNREPLREVDVNGIRFRIHDGGSKLIRISDDPNTIRLVPKRTKIAGVTFFRSKHGNLYRSGLIKAKTKTIKTKSAELCPTFTNTGICGRGPNCRFTHDPSKVAICKAFLSKGTCAFGDHCNLSHTPTPNRVPACIHFVRGNCTNDECRYAHVNINPSAPVCRNFAVLGYCDKGSDCNERHVVECPDYANKGACGNKKCKLPHVDRAGKLRQAANAQSSTAATEDSSSDLSSEEEDHSDDIDSDEDILIQGVDGGGQELTANQDFVGF